MNLSVRPSWLSLALTAVGAGAIGFSLVQTHTAHRPVWVLVVGLASTVLWLVRSVLAKAELSRSALVCAVASVVTGALVAAPTEGLTVVPAAVGVLAVIGDLAYPVWAGTGLGAVGVVLIAVGAVPAHAQVPAVLAMIGGLILGGFAGLSRRQFRRAEEQTALLRERDLQMREEASRIAIARDLHDVLAHSLGGLVIQLDAVEALLESGDDAAAHARVSEARRLAGDGLAEARRAVAALRDPGAAGVTPVVAADVEASLEDLVADHRSLGGNASLAVRGDARAVGGEGRTVGPTQAVALQRALQEALSNARKHAPGEPVRAELVWEDDRVRLTVSNPLAAVPASSALAGSGGGHGLEGMRERFAALPLGGTAAAGRDGDTFTVTAEARLA